MRLIFIAPYLAVFLSSCVTQSGRPSIVSPVKPAPSVTVDSRLASLKGGIVGQLSDIALGENARQQALAAEYNALERIDPDQALTWSDTAGGVSGQVVPLQPYRVGQQNCRAYTHTITKAGQSQSGRGTACRNEAGSWELLL